MDSGLVAVVFILGLLLLAVGLIVTTLPLLSVTSISAVWLVLGAACLIAGAVPLWRVRKWGTAPHAGEPRNSSRPFFAVLGIFNLLVFAASLSVHAEGWRGVIWGVAALGIGVCAFAIVRRPKN